MDKGFIEGQVAVVRDQTKWGDFIVRTQDGDYHVDFDDGYYHQCVAEKLDGKTVRLGYYSMETNPDGTRWVQAGDDNTLKEMETDENLEEDEPPRRILKRLSITINNVVKEAKKEEKKEVMAVKKMEDEKREKPQRRKVFFKIIVPNYNNYLYIKKCLDSIKEQTFKDYVCIVVDDLSTDDSFKIAQIYAKRDPEHFVAIQLEKKGYAGAARNKGLDYSIESDYLIFLDSDDWICQKDSFEKLYKKIIIDKFPDIVRCSYLFSGRQIKETNNPDIFVIYGAAPWKNVVNSKYSWIRFKENRSKCNDVVWFMRLVDSIDFSKISTMNDVPLVFYNTKSVTSCWYGKGKNSKNNDNAIRLLLEDLRKEKYKTSICNRYKDIEFKKYKNYDIEYRKSQAKSHEKIQKIIAMSSFPDRKSGMLEVVKKLHKQCDIMYIWLNDYNSIPNELNQYKNVIPVLAEEYSCLKENGRLFWVNSYKSSYYIIVDDDIDYPDNYVQEICNGIDKYNKKAIVSYHGSIFDNNSEKRFAFFKELKEDKQVHRIGGGVCAFIPKEIGFSCPHDIYQMQEWDGDSTISVWATKHNVKKICLKHKFGFLKNLLVDNLDISNVKKLSIKNITKQKRQHDYESIKKWEVLEF